MNRPWMPLWIADYLRDTSHLRALESGAYLHLIMAYWVNGCLPQNERQLATIAKVTDEEWYEIRDTVAAFFGPNFSSHKRIDHELAETADKIAKKSAAGKIGGEASAASRASKRTTDASAEVQANGKQTATQSQSHTQLKKEGAFAPPPIKKDRRRATQLPDDLIADRAAQEAAGLSASEGTLEFTKFRNHARERGRTCVDWRAAERNWYLKAAEFRGRKPLSAVPTEPAIPNEFAVKRFKDTGAWNIHYGPEPGRPGCRAPDEILERYGFKKDAA